MEHVERVEQAEQVEQVDQGERNKQDRKDDNMRSQVSPLCLSLLVSGACERTERSDSGFVSSLCSWCLVAHQLSTHHYCNTSPLPQNHDFLSAVSRHNTWQDL